MTDPIAFLCAMPMELTPLTKRLGLGKDNVNGVDLRTGRLDDRDVVAIVTGMGTELATRGAERLLDAITPAHVVVFGITGALDNDTPIGTLVLPEVVVNSETGDEFTHTPLGGGPRRGIMWTTNVMTPEDELPGLRAKGVVALDMETAAVAACCERESIPWSVFRVISDRASDGSVVEDVFKLSNQDGTPNMGRVARYVLRHPQRIPVLMALSKGVKLATERAADAAISAVRSLPS
ncbi:MAG: hypothetical protein WD691_10375 [Acidimicrobiales bacterium]